MGVIEAYGVPTKEDSVGVMRIQGKAVRDGQEGWVTVLGTQGLKYLEEGGNLYKVLQDIPLLKDPAGPSNNDDSNVVRKLKKDEILEVFTWEHSPDGSRVVRVQARAKNDAAVGWALVIDKLNSICLAVV